MQSFSSGVILVLGGRNRNLNLLSNVTEFKETKSDKTKKAHALKQNSKYLENYLKWCLWTYTVQLLYFTLQMTTVLPEILTINSIFQDTFLVTLIIASDLLVPYFCSIIFYLIPYRKQMHRAGKYNTKYFVSRYMENVLNRTQQSWFSCLSTSKTLILPEKLMFNQFWKASVLISEITHIFQFRSF